jgi:hypothetical protein
LGLQGATGIVAIVREVLGALCEQDKETHDEEEGCEKLHHERRWKLMLSENIFFLSHLFFFVLSTDKGIPTVRAENVTT